MTPAASSRGARARRLRRAATAVSGAWLAASVLAQGEAPPSKPMPDLRGKTCDLASAMLKQEDLLARCMPGAATHQYPAGTINDERPAPGGYTNSDVPVVLYVEPPSKGPASQAVPSPAAPMRMPDLRRQPCKRALVELNGDGYRGKARCAVGATTGQVAPGAVNDERPGPGEVVEPGEAVVLFIEPQPVSQPAPAPVATDDATVPDVRQEPWKQAFVDVEHAGLRPRAEGKAPPGAVVVGSQRPLAGSSVPAGSEVLLEPVSAETSASAVPPPIPNPPPWWRQWPGRALLGAGLVGALTLAWRGGRSGREPQPAPSPGPTPRSAFVPRPALSWRAVRDDVPVVTLRGASEDRAPVGASSIAWRVVGDDGVVTLRGLAPESVFGDDHDHS